MENFDGITFRGKFRNYQQRVLNSANYYFKDGKINIVAAPGSGKTILGLELIRRLNSPCLILSPTTTIKQQWADRFEEMFLSDEQKVENYVSFDLKHTSLLTSITYQALHSAINKIACKNDDEVVDNSKVDIFKIIKENKIKTICLDESHHLQNEWQKALEKFISMLDKKIKIISLTATPPYDATILEWQRYTDVCGEIDEEIAVPELVEQKNLCPHQDFVYFNFPTDKEKRAIEKYQEKVEKAIDQICDLPIFADIYQNVINSCQDKVESLITYSDEYLAMFSLFEHANYEVTPMLLKKISKKAKTPEFNLDQAQTAIQFILDSDFIEPEGNQEIIDLLKSHALFSENKINFQLSDKLKKKLISSVGKLKSIEQIVPSEIKNFGKELRMLVLTDYIRKETIKNIGTIEPFDEISIVSIFETIRRVTDCKIGVVSGTLFILPDTIDEYLSSKKFEFKKKPLPNTKYAVYDLKSSNNDKVKLANDIFSNGLVNILIGTKSLLGEGWDSPCINSLILASFVGSFMLSNQMRGRAIRIDKNKPNKIANIWHLVTIEPNFNINENLTEEQQFQELTSCDYDTLKRRFDCFVGPNYESKTIESGIERLTTIKPPYSESGIYNINQNMLALSQDKERLTSSWSASVKKSTYMHLESQIPKNKRMRAYNWKNISLILFFIFIELALVGVLVSTFIISSLKNFSTLAFIFFLILTLIASGVIFYSAKKLRAHINPKNSIKTFAEAILNAFKTNKMINKNVKLVVSDDDNESTIRVYLKNGKRKEQDIFNTAICELLSPIDNPKYIIVKKNASSFNYIYSFSCPTALSKTKNLAQSLQKELNSSSGNFVLVHTSGNNGKKVLNKCKKFSYVMFNKKEIRKKQSNK